MSKKYCCLLASENGMFQPVPVSKNPQNPYDIYLMLYRLLMMDGKTVRNM
jgi:hypothetical protein